MWHERERRIDARFGVLATLIAEPNRNRDQHPEPFSPADFFGSLRADEDDKEQEEVSDAAAMAQLEAVFGPIPWRGAPPPGWQGEVV